MGLEPWVCVTPAVAAAVGYTVFVVRNAVDVVYWDYWVNVGVLHAFDDGRLTWSQLWKQAVNNRVVVPRLITFGVARWFALDVRVEIFAAIAFLATAVVLLMLTQRHNDGGPLYLYAPVAVFMFSVVQWQTALWNVQMPRFLIVALFALAMFAVCRSSGWASFAVAAGAAVIASLCLLDGFLLWPAVAFLICFDGRPQRGRRLGAWAAVAAVTAIVYFIGFDFTAGNPSGLGWVVTHPLDALRYFLVLLGGFTRATPMSTRFASACGIVLLAMAAWVVARFWRSDRRLADALPVALVTFVIVFDVWTMIGRGAAGAGQALASRYTTYNLLLFVAAYLALVNRAAWRVANRRKTQIVFAVGGVGAALTVLLAIVSVTTARREGDRFAAHLRASARVLQHYRTEPPTQLDAYLCPMFCRDLVLVEAPFLEAHRYSVFAEAGTR